MKEKGRNRTLALLLTAVMLLLAPAAQAELFPDSDEMDMVHWGIALTVKMLAGAVDKNEKEPGAVYQSMLQIDPLNPEQAFIVQLTGDQAYTLEKGVGEHGFFRTPGAIAKAHNSLRDEAYAVAADGLVSHVSSKTGFGNTMVILTYGDHISLSAIDGDSIWSSFMTSTPEASSALTEESVAAFGAQYGVEGASILRYAGESLDTLLSLDKTRHGPGAADILWGNGIPSSKEIIADIGETETRLRALFPKIAGNPRMDPEMVMRCLDNYVTRHYDLASARLVSEAFVPMLGQTGALDFMDFLRGVTDSDLKRFPAPEIAYADEGENAPLKENATYLIVAERLNADSDPVYGCDMLMESVLPPQAIPASADEADYIVRVTADWNGGKYTQGKLEVYYANVRIGVYDAETGARVRNLGSYTQKLTGIMRVTSNVTYLNPYRELIWVRVRDLFK